MERINKKLRTYPDAEKQVFKLGQERGTNITRIVRTTPIEYQKQYLSYNPLHQKFFSIPLAFRLKHANAL